MPETIETDLSALWSDVARDGPAARAVMSNLVIFRESGTTEDVDVTASLDEASVVEVARRHPSRVIVLIHARTAGECRAPVAAAVGILTFGAGEARHAVEQIAIRSQCTEQSLPSIVRRFVLGDVPTSVWWTDDLSRTAPLGALVTMGRQLIYDSRKWSDVRAGLATVARLLDDPHAPDIADLNWRRLAPMRRALLHELGAAGGVGDAPAVRASVAHRHDEAALAWLLAGWLSSLPGRPGGLSGRGLAPTVSRQSASTAGDHTLSVSIEVVGRATLTATMDGQQITVTQPSAAPSFSLTAPRESEAAGVAGELQTLGRDIGLVESVRAANVPMQSA